MPTENKIKEDPDCYTFECTSELILENDIIKVEVDGHYEQEESVELKSECENVESSEIKSELLESGIQIGQFECLQESVVDKGMNINRAISMRPIVLSRLEQSRIKADDIVPENDKQYEDSLHLCMCNTIDTHDKLKQVCNVWNRTFSSLSNLSRRKCIHTEEKRFPCYTCSRVFKYKGHLINHLKNHSEIKPHICNICYKTYTSVSILRQHLHVHAKVFSCNICGKSFNGSSQLTRHFKVHKKIQYHVCNICNKYFSTPSHLSRHKYIHTEEKLVLQRL